MNREQLLEEKRKSFEAWAESYSTFPLERDDCPSFGTTSYTVMEQAMLWDAWQAALSTPAEPRTVEPLTKSEVNACWDGLMPGGHGKSRYDIAALLSDAFAAKNGLVLAGGEG